MRLRNIEDSKELLDIAFKRARKSASSYPKQKTPFYTLKGKEIAKIDEVGTYLDERLMTIVKEFPSIDKLDDFYHDLFISIIDIDKVRISLSKISSAVRLISTLRRDSIIVIKEMFYEKGANEKVKGITNKFFGRVSSSLKSIEKDLKIYNDAAKKLKELPSIKSGEELYLMAGLPNVGKSTLMTKITSSKPKIAAYPFTTKGLNVGTFFKKYLPIQVIDTPGLLDRPISERNQIELKAISAFQHLKGTIIFVIDPMYALDEQVNLFKELKKLFSDKGFIVVINKTDLASEKEIENAKKEFKNNFIILEGNGLNNLKEELLK